MESRRWWTVTAQCPQVGFLMLRCRMCLSKSSFTTNCPLEHKSLLVHHSPSDQLPSHYPAVSMELTQVCLKTFDVTQDIEWKTINKSRFGWALQTLLFKWPWDPLFISHRPFQIIAGTAWWGEIKSVGWKNGSWEEENSCLRPPEPWHPQRVSSWYSRTSFHALIQWLEASWSLLREQIAEVRPAPAVSNICMCNEKHGQFWPQIPIPKPRLVLKFG